jgi:hypothetical protein
MAAAKDKNTVILTEGKTATVRIVKAPHTVDAVQTLNRLFRIYGPLKELTRETGNPGLNGRLHQVTFDGEKYWCPRVGETWSIPLRIGSTAELRSVASLLEITLA